jgi:hypothetical protein
VFAPTTLPVGKWRITSVFPGFGDNQDEQKLT